MRGLTKAQMELLCELPTHVVPEYRPAQALVAKGLAVWRDDKTTMLDPTPAGRLALSSKPGGGE
jgi:hypothetical protein